MHLKEYSITKDNLSQKVDLSKLFDEIKDSAITEFDSLARKGDTLFVRLTSGLLDYSDLNNLVLNHAPNSTDSALPSFTNKLSVNIKNNVQGKNVYFGIGSFYRLPNENIVSVMVYLKIDDKIDQFDLRLMNKNLGEIVLEKKNLVPTSSNLYLFNIEGDLSEGEIELQIKRETGSANSIIGEEMRVFYN